MRIYWFELAPSLSVAECLQTNQELGIVPVYKGPLSIRLWLIVYVSTHPFTYGKLVGWLLKDMMQEMSLL